MAFVFIKSWLPLFLSVCYLWLLDLGWIFILIAGFRLVLFHQQHIWQGIIFWRGFCFSYWADHLFKMSYSLEALRDVAISLASLPLFPCDCKVLRCLKVWKFIFLVFTTIWPQLTSPNPNVLVKSCRILLVLPFPSRWKSDSAT